MTRVLDSYVTGAWTGTDGASVPLVDASTGDEVARFASGGIDAASVR